MSLATQIIDQQVSGIVTRLEDTLTNELRISPDDTGKRQAISFLYLVARTMFGLDEDEIIDGIVDGSGDYGIDALYFTSPDQGEINIALLQGKYRANLAGTANFPENSVVKMIDAIGALFDPEQDLEVNERLRKRIEDVRSFVAGGAIPQVSAIAANNGAKWTQQAQQRIDNAGKEFGSQVDWRHIGSEELLTMLQAQKPIDAELHLVGQASVETFDYRRVLTGRMSVSELARLTGEYGNLLFERNIRRYLGLTGNRVNEAVAETLRTPDQRPNFYFYNNGITITCSQFRHNALQKGNWHVQISNLQIINGGQTARTVQEVVEKSRQEEQEIGVAEVLVRIYELRRDDNNLIEQITFATNSQNPVELSDLRANDPRQKDLGQSIASLGYTYRAKREDHPVKSDEFTSAVIAEAVLAIWRYRPHQARFGRRRHFGALYTRIFTPDMNGAQAIIAALLHRHAENHRKRPPDDAPDFLPYGSRFIAMLMGQYLLEDMEITVEQIDHKNFTRVRDLVEKNASDYLSRAEEEISSALDQLFNGRERTLQRLSATFRRADLIQTLMPQKQTCTGSLHDPVA